MSLTFGMARRHKGVVTQLFSHYKGVFYYSSNLFDAEFSNSSVTAAKLPEVA